jgi:hypothetical protein
MGFDPTALAFGGQVILDTISSNCPYFRIKEFFHLAQLLNHGDAP